jgi:hypothetical protein
MDLKFQIPNFKFSKPCFIRGSISNIITSAVPERGPSPRSLFSRALATGFFCRHSPGHEDRPKTAAHPLSRERFGEDH